MRLILVLLLVCAAAGGAAWLLLREEPAALTLEESAGVVRGPGGAPRALGDGPVETPRIGLMSERDRNLVADPEGGAWEMRMLRFAAAPGEKLTGKAVLEAVARHLYVRFRDGETLKAFEQVRFDIDPAVEMPLNALDPLLRVAGYTSQVKNPVLTVRRLPPPR
jgi:hypothetical protein